MTKIIEIMNNLLYLRVPKGVKIVLIKSKK